MSALETMGNILSQQSLVNADLRYCLINKDKIPYKVNGVKVQPNNINDFVRLEDLQIDNLSKYAGIGISVQASNICAIDVDHCFNTPFDIESGDARAQDILKIFKDYYCEFSFSGTGLRILFRHDVIDNYKNTYYIKNSKNNIEYYQPGDSYRYVTLTGKPVFSNKVKSCPDSTLYEFLNKYMIRPIRQSTGEISSPKIENRTIEELLQLVKYHYLTNNHFQEVWFSKAPGSNSDESDRDFYLLSYMFKNITQDKEKLKSLFECSPFFQSKDWKHMNKWEYNNNRYYNYMYERIE